MSLLQVLVYLDDLIVFSRTIEENEERLMKVLDRLEAYGLKLAIDKCQYCQTSIKCVQHVVSQKEVSLIQRRFRQWLWPKYYRELKRFLEFTGYYQWFVENYAVIVKPLNDRTQGFQVGKKENIQEMEKEEPEGAPDPVQHDPLVLFGLC